MQQTLDGCVADYESSVMTELNLEQPVVSVCSAVKCFDAIKPQKVVSGALCWTGAVSLVEIE